MHYVDSFETALYSAAYADPQVGYRAFIDAKSFIDFFLVNEISRNNDGFKTSRYFHKDRLGVIHAGPVWDFDWAWKNVDECSIFSAADGSGWAHLVNDCGPDVNSPGYYVRMLQDSVFAGELGCRWQEYRADFLSTAWLHHIVDSVALLVNEAQERQFSKYPILGVNNGTPEIGPVPTTFQGEVDALKDWIATRMTWLDAHMPACAYLGTPEQELLDARVFPNPAGNELFLVAPKGTIGVHVLDASGRVMMTVKDANVPRSIDLTSWPSGLYAVRFHLAGSEEHVIRFVKE
jgi:hypothetical protein